jgi:hypothetical protein
MIPSLTRVNPFSFSSWTKQSLKRNPRHFDGVVYFFFFLFRYILIALFWNEFKKKKRGSCSETNPFSLAKIQHNTRASLLFFLKLRLKFLYIPLSNIYE